MVSNSVFFSLMYRFLKFMEKTAANSLAVRAVLFLYRGIVQFFRNSFTAVLLDRFSAWIAGNFFETGLWNGVIKRRDRLSRQWESSRVFRLLNQALNFPSQALRPLYERAESSFTGSYTFILLKSVLRKFEMVIGASLLFIVAVPHAQWNNAYGILLVFLLLFLYFIKTVVWKYTKFELRAVDPMLFVFILTVVLAAGFSVFPKISVKFLVFYMAAFLLVLLIISSIKTVHNLEILIEGLLIGVTLTGLYGIWQRFVGVPFDPALTDALLNEGMAGRVFSTMGNANNYAELLVMTLPFYAAVVWNAKSMLKKVIFGLFMLPPLVSLIFTGSRSGWIALVAAVFVILFFKNWKLIPLAIALGILSFPVLPLVAPAMYRRILTIFNPNDTSVGYRTLIMETVAPMFRDFWTTGVGLGTAPFIRVIQRYFLGALNNGEVAPPHTHKLFYEIWIETGVVGVVSFIWFHVRLIKHQVFHIFSRSHNQINNILIAGMASIAGIFVMGLAEYVWFYNRVMLIFWVIVGILLTGLNIISKRQELLNKQSE